MAMPNSTSGQRVVDPRKPLLHLLSTNGHNVNYKNDDDMENTAFSFAAAIGNVEAADILLKKNARLPSIRVRDDVTPLYLSVLNGKRDMGFYLFAQSKHMLQEHDWITVYLTSISSGLYDLALAMLTERESLASARVVEGGETGLHVLARKHTLCDCERYWRPKHSCRDTPIFRLMKRMLDILIASQDLEKREAVTEATEATFIAVETGNFDFVSTIMRAYPDLDLVYELNDKGQSILQIAILHRRDKIFNLIHEVAGPFKSFLNAFVDGTNNNLLHSAAKLAPQDRLKMVSGAALQMTLELSWFEEVKKIVPPSFVEMKNSDALTPSQLFSKEHEELARQGEIWMKGTANCCMVVACLVATAVFAASFSLPGGYNDEAKSPNYLGDPLFLAFSLSIATAMISSSISIMVFLSILISRFAEKDFRRSLPMKLTFGLLTLFLSIVGMMVAFGTAFFITYHHGLKWVPIVISTLAALSIPVFTCLQLSLWFDIAYCLYICSSLLKPNRHM